MNLPSPDALQVALTCTTILAVWVGWAKFIGPRVKRGWGRVVGIFQAIAGRDAIVDKVSGKEVAPAVPPLGEQLSTMNETIAKLVAVIESNHDAHERLNAHDKHLVAHDQAIGALISGSLERAATAMSSAALLNAVANGDIVNGDTDEPGGEL